MNESINQDNPMFTAYAAGELEGAELEQFESLLQDPSAAKELEDTQAMISLLTDSFADELQSAFALADEDHSLTDFAVGELSEDGIDRVEGLLESSSEAQAELDGIQEMAALLSDSLEGEWRSRDTVELDVPAFTDFVLGELSENESAEFQTILKYSETARKELGETEDMVSLLSEGLENEWRSELSAADHEFSLVEATGEENVVSVNFSQENREAARSAKSRGPVLVSLAAVLAGLLVVGGMLSQSGSDQGAVASAIVGFSSDDHVWFDDADKAVEIAEVPADSINLVLLEEVGQPLDLELAEFDAFDPMVAFDEADGFVKVSIEDDVLPVQFPIEEETYASSGHFFYTGASVADYDNNFGFVLDAFSEDAAPVDIEDELRAIIHEMDSPDVDLKSVRERLNILLEAQSLQIAN